MSYRRLLSRRKSQILSIGAALIFLSIPLTRLHAETENPKSAGYLYADGPNSEKIILPLKKTEVNLDVTGGLIRAEVTQTFQNTSPHHLEAVYVFPLPSQSTVTDLALIFKDKMIKSVVKEREEAKAVYEKAKDEGKKTALLDEERPNIFTTSVANFGPGETVEVKISYLEPATFINGQYHIMFPTVVGPRFIPFSQMKDEGPEVIARITPPLLPEGMASDHQFVMHVSVSGIPYENISSPTHDINIDAQDATNAEVTLGKKDVPNRDFVLKIPVKSQADPIVTGIQNKTKGDYFGLWQIYPPKLTGTDMTAPREVIFLVDTSGSMLGESMEQARKALLTCLKMLPTQDSFNIVRFSDDFSSFSPQSLPASKANLAKGLAYIDQLKADGGTNMQPALGYVLQTPSDPKKMRIIIFMTDGDVGNEADLMRLIHSDLSKARIFPFGIGSAPNEYLLRKMGELGRGVTHFIHSAEEIDAILTQFFGTLGAPILTNIEIHWLAGNGKEVFGIESFPKQLPDIFADRPLQLITKSSQLFNGNLVVEGETQQGKVKFSYPLPTGLKNAAGIRTLYGKATADELLYRHSFPNSSTDLDALKKQIIEVALDYQLITPFTSRVAVEQKISRKPNGEIVTVDVPTLLPDGWDRAGLVATASDDVAYFAAGLLTVLTSGIVLVFGRKRRIGW